jgi:hypothetical protein
MGFHTIYLEKYFGEDIESFFTEKYGNDSWLVRYYLEKGFKNRL